MKPDFPGWTKHLATIALVVACIAIILVICLIPKDGLAVDAVYEAF